MADILYTPEHHQAARDAFQLNCPHCHCKAGSRVEKHSPSFRTYRRDAIDRLAAT